MRVPDVLTLSFLSRGSDAALLLMRLMIGSFLIFGVWDNIASVERMTELEGFLSKFGFPAPELMAPLSVWAQFACGVAFIAGLATRWAGLVCAFNFVVAIAMVDHHQRIRGSFPSASLRPGQPGPASGDLGTR
ncbi:DoxX family protein [Phenylobacterium sp.]|uniref:DoxX family protein n=1 Tax=Phenylobacterium sp. TaxID=1871053 RepID=UPI0027375735|nr:DoxX family protein [Phenylobacterium sp.]MDP3853366.1 DoxX family protein [Phenylobacterium sp.]